MCIFHPLNMKKEEPYGDSQETREKELWKKDNISDEELVALWQWFLIKLDFSKKN